VPIVPVSRSAVSDAVYAGLTEEILSGRLAPGVALPSERDLAEGFAVNRHAVREGLKRLRQAGLVAISQGGRTRVRDWRRHAGLDSLVALATSGAVPPARLIDDILQMRAAVGADAARLCADRASDAEVAVIVAAAEDYPLAPVPAGQLVAIDLVFWTAVVDGAHNTAYRLGLNTLSSSIAGIGAERFAGLLEEYADRGAHTALAERVAARDAEGAFTRAQHLLALPLRSSVEPACST
jgi:GntR family transcriptional repressor for pyruvate dehydrogenase complex